MTLVPVRVEPLFRATVLGSATAFFYALNGRPFLVTNWHVTTGRDPATGELLPNNKFASKPDSLRLHIPFRSIENGKSLLGWRAQDLPLYEDPELERPVWQEHPTHGRQVDIIAIPLSGLEETALRSANDASLDLEDLALYPSLDVFVLGYPQGMYGGAQLPVWKRGSIASEPDFDIDGLPKFYVDTATREGMSGAPVYAQEVGLWSPGGAAFSDNSRFGKGRAFVGVYAGRVGAEDEFKAQLGIVWKASALLDILLAAKPEDKMGGAVSGA